jgi:hypothetical protein
LVLKKILFIALLFALQYHDYRRPPAEQDPKVQDSGVVGQGLHCSGSGFRLCEVDKISDVSTAEHMHVSSLCTFTFYKTGRIGDHQSNIGKLITEHHGTIQHK